MIAKVWQRHFDKHFQEPTRVRASRGRISYAIFPISLSISRLAHDAVVYMDLKGNLNSQILGVPVCWTDSTDCSFLTSADAIAIAKRAGFEKGVVDWAAQLAWSRSAPDGYVWKVRNITKKTNDIEWGSTMKIDAITGEIYETKDYVFEPHRPMVRPPIPTNATAH